MESNSISGRALDKDGEVVDVYLQARRDGAAAKRLFKRLLRTPLIPLASMLTIGPSKHMGTPGFESVVCVSLNQSSRLKDLWVLMLRSAIFSIWYGTRSALNSTGIFR